MGRSKKLPKLDLHGFQVVEVFDKVDQFIHRQNNQPKVCIVTGKGSGAVQKEVQRYLKLGGFPWHFEVLENGNKNMGSLIVILE